MLDKLVSGAAQSMMGGQGRSLMAIISSLLSGSGGSGGLAGLVQHFQQAGLGEQVQSWIGSGQNLPISAEQLMQVFGAERMQQMAASAGMDQQQLGGQLAAMLPQAVDRLTPEGQIPSGGVDDALGMLSKLMPR
jgi:uncharacterized protein YidB (DUF937 family)